MMLAAAAGIQRDFRLVKLQMMRIKGFMNPFVSSFFYNTSVNFTTLADFSRLLVE